jgi:UDP-N-acetylmuramoylalanine--D-glutamate ligase
MNLKRYFLKKVPPLKGKKVLVMGLGLFGGAESVVRFLVKNKAHVIVTDLKPYEKLKETIDRLSSLPVEFHLGSHLENDFKVADLIVVNPAVRHDSRYLRIAVNRGIPLETETNLFFKLCKARRIIGITGSNGKTTTCALVYEILKRTNKNVWLGGNIGSSLIEKVDKIKEADIVILELSSFQLKSLGAIKISPHVACILNISENHLDWHGSMKDYINAKRSIIEHQKRDDFKVMNLDDPLLRRWARNYVSKTIFFSMNKTIDKGGFLHEDERLIFKFQGFCLQLDVKKRKLLGRFNLQNILAAGSISYLFAQDQANWSKVAEEVFTGFKGVEHRLEFVKQVKGISFYNDSIATNPESTIAALDALAGSCVLILGGYDKGLSFKRLIDKINQADVRHVILMGQTKEKLEGLLRQSGFFRIKIADSLHDAVKKAPELAKRGDKVIFSPACASYDMFSNFVERGNLFKEYVGRIF